MLICNWAILRAIHRGLLLKSLKALCANPRAEYTLGNLLNEYLGAKEIRGRAYVRRRLEGYAAVLVNDGAAKLAPAPSPAARVRQ
jgi:hypothetical protein